MTRLYNSTEQKDECPALFSTSTGQRHYRTYSRSSTSNKFTDPQYTALNCSGPGTGVNQYGFYAFKSAAAGTLHLLLSGYARSPPSQAALQW